jgi:hypothetical protein
LDAAQPPTDLAGFAALHTLPVTGVTERHPRSYGDLLWIRLLARGQASEIVAALDPAALAIIADFRAQRWALTTTYRENPVSAELARVRAAEWLRITTSVSMPMTSYFAVNEPDRLPYDTNTRPGRDQRRIAEPLRDTEIDATGHRHARIKCWRAAVNRLGRRHQHPTRRQLALDPTETANGRHEPTGRRTVPVHRAI